MPIRGISQCQEQLIHRLTELGMNKNSVLELIWSIKSLYLINPNLSSYQIKSRLSHLGFDDVIIDDHTIKMAINCFKGEGSKETTSISPEKTDHQIAPV